MLLGKRVGIFLALGQRDLCEGRDLGEQLVSGNWHVGASMGRKQGNLWGRK